MPCTHETYISREGAEAALVHDIARYKRTGRGGKSWKRLNVFPCGNHFHIGRANKLPANYKPAPESASIPSTGELRRKLTRMAEAWTRREDYEIRQRAEALGRLIQAEQAVI